MGRTLPPDLVTKHLLCAHLSRGQHLIGEATPAALGMEGENSHRGARGPHQAACPPVTTQVQGPQADLHAVIRGRTPSGGTIPRAASLHGAGRCRRLHHRNKALIADDTSPAFQNGNPGRYACLPGVVGLYCSVGLGACRWAPVGSSDHQAPLETSPEDPGQPGASTHAWALASQPLAPPGTAGSPAKCGSRPVPLLPPSPDLACWADGADGMRGG